MEDWISNDRSTSGRFYVICLTLDGIPLFSRSNGNLPNLPFPVMGSLNGVHMFAKNNLTELGFTTADNASITWKEFHKIKIIIINFDRNVTEYHLNLMVENVYKCMVMTIGENEFTKINNVEKLKKKTKLSLPLVMKCLNPTQLLSNVTQTTDIVLCSEIAVIQNTLNAYTDECQSEFGCLILHGKVIAGTEKFWQLLPIETSLMLHLMETIPLLSASDIPIYLPNGSPTVPHRLIAINLLENIKVMIVCGPEPSLQDVLHKYAKKYWMPLTQILQSCSRLYPRWFPPEIKLDINLLGFVLVNVTEGKCLSSFHPHGNMTGADQVYLSEKEKRKCALVSFYRTVVGDIFVRIDEERKCKKFPHEVIETYSCTDQYKCYALQTSNHQLFTLFGNDVPSYSLGNITKQILRQLTKDRII